MKLLKRPGSAFMLWYLRSMAKKRIKKVSPLIIGVGGSSGKSSLTSLISIILKGKQKVVSSEGKNSETGIPLSVLNLGLRNYKISEWLKVILKAPFKSRFGKPFDVYVAEMGIDSPYEPKNMSYLLKVIEPKIAVLTNISHEHSVYFDSLVSDLDKDDRKDKILTLTAKEELLLLKRLPKDGIAILNIDDLNIEEAENLIKAKKITVSEKTKADFYIKGITTRLNKFILNFSAFGKDYELKLNRPLPSHYAKTIILSIAATFAAGFEIKDSITRVEKNFTLPPGRFSVFKGVKESIVIDSSYNNATLEPLLDILEFVRTSTKRRKVAIIGDLRELGTISEYAHKKAGEKIAESVDFAVLIGPQMQRYAAPILEKKKVFYKSFLTFSEARYFILTNIKKKDLILVKGSQNTLLLERAVEMLLKNPKDAEKLCRRGKYWDEIRKKTT